MNIIRPLNALGDCGFIIFSVLNLKCILNGANVILILNKAHLKFKLIKFRSGTITTYHHRT